jgi:hypothetical protein
MILISKIQSSNFGELNILDYVVLDSLASQAWEI